MIKEPVFFERNRVGRVYTGGKLFAEFFGDEAVDGYEPEEWIASRVKAVNKVQKSAHDGVSKLLGSEMYFDELLEKYPEEMLGKNRSFDILVKGLDSAIRLPAQAHPNREFSRKYFNSSYGKTECWIILDTRPGAKIFFGFKDGVTREDFERAIDESESDTDAMERLMKEVTVQKGDVYFVPAKTIHAIGAGCLILEIQEPTDFTIQPEHWCGEYKLSEKEMYMGLQREQAVDCFDFVKAPNARLFPKTLEKSESFVKESLVGPDDTDCFVINRISLCGGEYLMNVKDSYAVYIVTGGEIDIKGDGYSRKVKKGGYFFLPASLMGKFTLSGSAEIVECY